jgi:hypothetical protein
VTFDSFVDHDSWEEPTEEDYRQVDEQLLTSLVTSQLEVRPVEATTAFAQLRSAVRWYLAFNVDGWETRRRRYAQRRVAQNHDIAYTAVQDKVREVYDGKSGRESVQTLFEDDLEAIEEAYDRHLDMQ